MNLSYKSEYALKALVELAINYNNGEPVTLIADLAQNKKIPKKYLEQILLTLKNAGFLESKRGVGGGYSLKMPPDNISLGDILRVLEGPLTFIDESNKTRTQNLDEVTAALNGVMDEASKAVSIILDGTSLLDIVRRSIELKELKNRVLNYSI